ncbi:MAG: EAL domain-containing protein [Lachnospiraceae bacterium]|nr:EAL domain-containing protein [Lachnospiraceae bacterium]
MELTIAFDVSAFLLCLFCMMYELRKRKVRSKQNIVYLMMIGNLMCSAVVAVISNLIQQSPELRREAFRPLLVASLMAYFLIHNVLPAMYALYIRIVIGLDANSTRVRQMVFLLPAILGVVIVWLNLPFGWVFAVTEDMRFARRGMEYVLYAFSAFYLIAAFYYLARYHVALLKKTMNALYMYYIVTIFGVLFQLLFPSVKVELFFESIACLGLMLTFEEDEAMHDPVTGLLNRMAFRQDVTRLLATRQAFYCINVNFLNLRFYARIMNVESFHELLNNLAVWMREFGQRGNIYHFDENYTMLAFGAREEEIHALTDRMAKDLDAPFASGGIDAQFQSYISVAKAPEDIDSLDAVMDLLEYAKDNKGAHVTVQYRETLAYIRREAAVERALRNAVTHRAFQIYYQPIYSCETGNIVSAEALVRLFDEELGQVSPGEFIPIAEKSALIVEIGNIVFEKVCRFIQEHQPERYGIEYTEVNLSVAQFMQSNLVGKFGEILERYGVDASQINLEITESVASDSAEPFMLAVRQLEHMGFTFSMDDYGTGYSNIASILNVNFKNIKMDKSFLTKALDSEEGATILRDTTHLVRHLGRNALQEGVETREELNFVQEAGCNLIQGYYFSKPLPEADFLSFIRQFNQKEIA